VTGKDIEVIIDPNLMKNARNKTPNERVFFEV